ncbi:MAG: ABC transporter permease [Candidatus Auribacterota bacterium]
METYDIPWLGLAFACGLLLIPISVSKCWKLDLIRETVIATARMCVQLVLIALFLEYLFNLNSPLINICWISVMVLFAGSSITQTCKLNLIRVFPRVALSLLVSLFFILFYMRLLVIRGYGLFEAKYLIVLGGMLLGNSLRGTIVGLSSFYDSIRKEEKIYLYKLSLGARQFEALRPYLQHSMTTALKPTLATMATMGIVFLPGMMTGQVLGGSSPLLAIKYQIMIMIAIYLVITISIMFCIFLLRRLSFNDYGVLNHSIFKGSPR